MYVSGNGLGGQSPPDIGGRSRTLSLLHTDTVGECREVAALEGAVCDSWQDALLSRCGCVAA